MARSILPSKYHSPGKLITKTKRANRHAIRRELRSLVTDPSRQGDEWDELMDLRAYPDQEIGQLVQWRRGGDKIRHFERWAIAITNELPHEDRLSHMRAILPEGLIGDHAMSHLSERPELNPSSQWRRYSPTEAARRRADRIGAASERRRRLIVAIEQAIADGHHRAMNLELKSATGEDRDVPLILEPTRIERFVSELLTRGQYGSLIHWRAIKAIIAFLES